VCGIIGVTGAKDPLRVLLDGLAMLEYRGYDSAGVAIVGGEGEPMWRRRSAVRGESIAVIAAPSETIPAAPRAGVGHTRWATHGAPTEANAHPHLDCTGTIAVVHNGIIENHRELWAALAAGGHVQSSATDTEVIAHLIEAEVGAGAHLTEAVRRTIGVLTGDFAIAAVSTAEPDVIVATRRTSPLIVGRTKEMGVVASDLSALLPTTRELFALGDDQIAEIGPGVIRVLDAAGSQVEPVAVSVTWDIAAARCDGYDDFMSKEIHEQPRAIADTLLGRLVQGGGTEFEELLIEADKLREIDRVIVVACGSSYHAGLSGRAAFEELAQLPATAEIASEFRYRKPVVDDRTLVVAISQSGETVDTYHALKEAKRRGALTVVVTNVVDSLMARESDGVLYTRAGPEIGVASTKCHLSQLALVQAFALHLAGLRGALGTGEVAPLSAALSGLPAAVASAVGRFEEYRDVARRLEGINDVYFLGRNHGYPVALEGALKLKELAYVRAEAYPAGEMKHGPISLIVPGTVAVVVATRGALWPKLMANVEEVKARGAAVVAVCDEGDEETASLVDLVLPVPHVIEAISAVVAVVPLQVLAYGAARDRGNDVDRPRNLAKVVTVE
jgi:glucosamine--fructose-6-phosphate aminotransferase (isomerizing)